MTTIHSVPIRVALVGLGNIGFRHLQGLNSIAHRTQLLGVDLSADNLARAKAEWKGGGAQFTTGEDAPTGPVDALILATSSQGRLALMKRWGAALSPRHVILEKVTFTRMEDFAAAAALAAKWGASIHINCPRRLWPSFHALRDMLATESGLIRVALDDPDLGLACNGVHIVDAFQFLAGEDELRLEEAEIDQLFPAKRLGYSEAYGRLRIVTPKGDALTLVVRPRKAATGSADKRLHVARGGLALTLDQASGLATWGEGQRIDLGRAPYQSELTGTVIAALVCEGRCSLPSLAASARAHEMTLVPLRQAFAAQGLAVGEELPIT
jgi:hypothetical protein